MRQGLCNALFLGGAIALINPTAFGNEADPLPERSDLCSTLSQAIMLRLESLESKGTISKSVSHPAARRSVVEAVCHGLSERSEPLLAGSVEECAAAIASQVLLQDSIWQLAGNPGGDAAFWITVQYETYWYLTPPPLSSEQQLELKLQRERIIQYLKNIPQTIAMQTDLPDDLRKGFDRPFGIARHDVEAFLESPFYRFAQIPLAEGEFQSYLDNLQQSFRDSLPRYVGELERAKQTLPYGEVKARSILLEAAFFTHAAAARNFAFAHMNKEHARITRLQNEMRNHGEAVHSVESPLWFPFGVDGFGVRYTDEAFGKGILFHMHSLKLEPDSR
jgi:hypothetical protein